MSRGRSYREYYPESKPLATGEGLKAKSKRGEFAGSWWATRWIEALERLMDAGRLRRGRRYARQGQVLSIEERAGGVTAGVQGSRSRPYRVDVELEPLSEEQWQRVTDALAAHALFVARLLAGEMPEDIEAAFKEAGTSLFPDRKGQIRTSCTCPDPATVCKHTAAVHYLLAERFEEDPFLLFRLRGRTEEQLRNTLQQRSGGADPDAEEPTGPEAMPLEEDLDGFWEARGKLEEVEVTIKEPAVELSVLRRLGQPGFVGEDLQHLLAPAYRAASRRALELALGEREEPEGEEDGRGGAS